MLEREYPDPGALQRVRVHVPDRPGVLAGITQALGAERINIEDFELHHISPERGGTLHAARRPARARRSAPRRCSRARATASSSRRCSTSEDRARSRARRPHRRPGRQVDLAPRAAARRGLATARRASAAWAAPATPSRRSPPCARSACEVDEDGVDELVVHGVGLRGPAAPAEPIDCGNAGTLARLIVGPARLPGRHVQADRRRVALAPADGARRRAAAPDGRADRDDRRPPAADDHRRRRSQAIDYELPVASAQVKSAILLAGLGARRARRR